MSISATTRLLSAVGAAAVPAGAVDWAIAVGVAALSLGGGLSGQHPDGGREVLGAVLLAAAGLALLARRRAPLVVLAVTALCTVGYEAAGFTVLSVPYLVAVYGAVRAGHRALTAAVSVALPLDEPLANGKRVFARSDADGG